MADSHPQAIYLVTTAIAIAGYTILLEAHPGMSLPPPTDPPEEILRTAIYTEARSPLDGQPLSATEYAELQEQLRDNNDRETAPDSIREVVFLLELRRVIKPILPIIP